MRYVRHKLSVNKQVMSGDVRCICRCFFAVHSGGKGYIFFAIFVKSNMQLPSVEGAIELTSASGKVDAVDTMVFLSQHMKPEETPSRLLLRCGSIKCVTAAHVQRPLVWRQPLRWAGVARSESFASVEAAEAAVTAHSAALRASIGELKTFVDCDGAIDAVTSAAQTARRFKATLIIFPLPIQQQSVLPAFIKSTTAEILLLRLVAAGLTNCGVLFARGEDFVDYSQIIALIDLDRTVFASPSLAVRLAARAARSRNVKLRLVGHFSRPQVQPGAELSGMSESHGSSMTWADEMRQRLTVAKELLDGMQRSLGGGVTVSSEICETSVLDEIDSTINTSSGRVLLCMERHRSVLLTNSLVHLRSYVWRDACESLLARCCSKSDVLISL